MHTIKLILTDLDGTVVLPHAHEVPLPAIKAIGNAEQQGIRVSAVTGRYFELSQGVLQQIGFRHACVFSGGSVIANPTTGEILWSQMLTVPKLHTIFQILSPHADTISMGHGRDTAFHDHALVIDDIVEPATHVWASVPAAKAKELLAQLNSYTDLIAHGNAGPGGDFTKVGIQVTDRKADKEHGVTKLLQMLQIDPKNVMAIGDGDNDLPLFKNAGLKVAMGNASEQLKAAADIVVGRVEDDGFAEALRNYVLKP
jgi:5-amino-6-(5-phospho-D-ribitylamino)uracil phosphatase